MFKKVFELAKNCSDRFKECNINSFAGGAAFFVFLSLVPIIILLCSVFPYINVSSDYVILLLDQIVPKDIELLLSDLVAEFQSYSIAAISVASLVTIWVAGKGIFALISGLNAVHGVVEKRNFFLLRARSSLYTLVFLALVVFSLVIMVFGTQINEFLILHIPNYSLVVAFFLHFRFFFFWTFLSFAFQFAYTFLPSLKLKFRDQLSGAVLASLGWSAFSWGFSVYVREFQGRGFNMYGSLTTLIMALIWLYACMYIFLVGAFVNVFFEPVFSQTTEARRIKKQYRREIRNAKRQKTVLR